jgi:hypothetical protein
MSLTAGLGKEREREKVKIDFDVVSRRWGERVLRSLCCGG